MENIPRDGTDNTEIAPGASNFEDYMNNIRGTHVTMSSAAAAKVRRLRMSMNMRGSCISKWSEANSRMMSGSLKQVEWGSKNPCADPEGWSVAIIIDEILAIVI